MYDWQQDLVCQIDRYEARPIDLMQFGSFLDNTTLGVVHRQSSTTLCHQSKICKLQTANPQIPPTNINIAHVY